MGKKFVQPFQSESWFLELTETLRDLVVEGEFSSRWSRIQTYHTLGASLAENLSKFPEGVDPVKAVAKAIKKSPRLCYQALQFVKKFPDINKLPDGKIITWRKIANELLPEHKKEKPNLKALIKEFIKNHYLGHRKDRKVFLAKGIETWELYG